MEKEKKLSKYAYGGIAGKDYVPYVTDGEKKYLSGQIAKQQNRAGMANRQ